MRVGFSTIALGLCCLVSSGTAQAQAFPNDNDGLLDVGESPRFPESPGAATSFNLLGQGIEDLDGTNLLTSIVAFRLSDNLVSGIDQADFSGLANLVWIEIRENRISTIHPDAFLGLKGLGYLDLSSNALSNIEHGTFSDLQNLRYLYLNGNDISRVDSTDFDGAVQLEELGLRDNAILEIKAGDLNGFVDLRRLDVRGNPITSIEGGAFSKLTNLETLFLDAGDLTELNLNSATLHSLLRYFPGFPIDGPPFGFLLRQGDAVKLLTLDSASLSSEAFDAILLQTEAVEKVSLVGLTFSDGAPPGLSSLLDIPTLDNVRIDPLLFSQYADELTAWDALAGNTLTVVPEPTAYLLGVLPGFVALNRRRRPGVSCTEVGS